MEEAIISTIEPRWGNPHNVGKQKEASIPMEKNYIVPQMKGYKNT
jgi:hypothetical protein